MWVRSGSLLAMAAHRSRPGGSAPLQAETRSRQNSNDPWPDLHSTKDGGSPGSGTVFKLNTDGSGFATVYSFSALVSSTNSDGANPQGGLVLSGATLYGTTTKGGSSGDGTVFAVSTIGTGFTNLHSLLGGRRWNRSAGRSGFGRQRPVWNSARRRHFRQRQRTSVLRLLRINLPPTRIREK